MRTITTAAVLIASMGSAVAQTAAPPGASACTGCHGPGKISASVTPLQGLPPDEIFTAMQAFRTGARPATVMDRIAKGFSDEETRAIATWLGQKR
jgi:cytochrome c553